MIKLEKTIQKMTILRADRSECNESEAKEMAGCLADGDWVIAYFPTLSAMRHANLLAAAPELLEALRELAEIGEAGVIERRETDKPTWNALGAIKSISRAAIAKAEGREA
jgi:hypothetical protein